MAEATSSNYWHFLSIGLTFLVTFIGTTYMYKSGAPASSLGSGGVTNTVKDLISYIPHTLILFGVIADIFTYEGVYSIASLIGVASIIANWVFGYIWSGLHTVVLDAQKTIAEKNIKESGGDFPTLQIRTPPSSAAGTGLAQTGSGQPGQYFRTYDGCSIEGFGSLQSKYTIQTLVITSTIMSYYMYDNITNRGGTAAAATIIAFLVFFFGQWWAIGDCDKPSPPATGLAAAAEGATKAVSNVFGKAQSPTDISATIRKVMSLIQGMFFGGIAYMTVESVDPSKLPSSLISPFPRKSVKDLKRTSDGRYSDGDGNFYVCLPNGQCFPDLSTAEARKKFADSIGNLLGTGKPAIPSECATS